MLQAGRLLVMEQQRVVRGETDLQRREEGLCSELCLERNYQKSLRIVLVSGVLPLARDRCSPGNQQGLEFYS